MSTLYKIALLFASLFLLGCQSKPKRIITIGGYSILIYEKFAYENGRSYIHFKFMARDSTCEVRVKNHGRDGWECLLHVQGNGLVNLESNDRFENFNCNYCYLEIFKMPYDEFCKQNKNAVESEFCYKINSTNWYKLGKDASGIEDMN
jgi:hypothetical protein